MPEPIPIPSAVTPLRRALVSVHDKTGVAELGRVLAEMGVQLVSTGGTAAHLKEAGVPVTLVEETITPATWPQPRSRPSTWSS
jgi:MGS-like domain